LNKLITANNFSKLSVILNGVGKAGTYGYGYGTGGSGYYDETPNPTLWAKVKDIFTKEKQEN